jgi:hypothetical protein
MEGLDFVNLLDRFEQTADAAPGSAAEEPMVCTTRRWREMDSNYLYRGTASAARPELTVDRLGFLAGGRKATMAPNVAD